ncbi:MAG: acyltransferase family protein [Christensenellaceae bacterium]|nr:acyltransferase family protein [Christensenellaceae bacterium]
MYKRDYSIDIARGLACLLVVVGHVPTIPSFLHTWIYSFHMPLFFIISGIVLNSNDYFPVFLKKRVKSLLVPYFALNLCAWIIETIIRVAGSVFASPSIGTRTIFDNFVGTIIGYRLTNYYYILWFVIALFFGLILAYGIVRIRNSFLWNVVIGISLIVCNAFIWRYVNGMPLSLDMVFLSTGFILIEYSMCSFIVNGSHGKMNIIGIPLLASAACVALIGSRYYGDVDLYKCQMGGYSY